MSIRVSVVVPTYRRPELLRRTLVALLAQDFAPAEYEIIVCDNATGGDSVGTETEMLIEEVRRDAERLLVADSSSFDGDGGSGELPDLPGIQLLTARRSDLIWLAAPELPSIHYIPVSRGQGPAVARNTGWRSAAGAIIAFTDDDCLPAPGWLSAGVTALDRDALLIGIMGCTLVPLPPTPTDHEVMVTGLERSEFITANCFYRREALSAVGGFDERFTMAWREDSDLFFAMLDRYGPSAFRKEPRALVVHPVREARWGASLPEQRRARFNALLYKKHPRYYRSRLAPVTPWHYYVIVGSVVVAMLALTLDEPLVASLAAGLWLLQTVRFAVQRLQRTARTPAHIAEMAVTSLLIPFLSLYWRLRGAVEHRILFL